MHGYGRAVALYALSIVVAGCAAGRGANAQVGPTPVTNQPPPPQISANGVGESRVTPDRAMVMIAVESRGQSAAAAASENAQKQMRVIDAVKATGVAAAQIRTSGYNVYPEYTQAPGSDPRVTGYRANNMVQVEVRSIENVAKVIDAALAAGATNIGGVNLFASNTDAARREALQQAVAKARAEAEVVAVAAGGSLGTMVEMVIDPASGPRPVEMSMLAARGGMQAPAPTPIEAGEQVVQAMVRVRWQFVPNQR